MSSASPTSLDRDLQPLIRNANAQPLGRRAGFFQLASQVPLDKLLDRCNLRIAAPRVAMADVQLAHSGGQRRGDARLRRAVPPADALHRWIVRNTHFALV